MDYEGIVYRPPSEARSLIIQVTIGCAHNTCGFCNMYKEKKFRIRSLTEILADLTEVSHNPYASYIEKVFLADGDALVMKTGREAGGFLRNGTGYFAEIGRRADPPARGGTRNRLCGRGIRRQ